MDEELINRQLPHSLEAEQSVLGSILIDSRCLTDVIGILRPEDFYLQQNREIYETIYTMFNFSETIDPVTVLNKMQELGVYHEMRSWSVPRKTAGALWRSSSRNDGIYADPFKPQNAWPADQGRRDHCASPSACAQKDGAITVNFILF